MTYLLGTEYESDADPFEWIRSIEGPAAGGGRCRGQRRRSLPHGQVAAVAAMAHRLGFPGLLGSV